MELLKLVIVDDEPIILQGLLGTYDWNAMGFTVAGSASSGEESLRVIRSVRPDVVLTDIRMKQITGLMVMEEIQKTDIGCLFIVISAYRDFTYAQKACSLGAFDYLLKPIEDEVLQETMARAHAACLKRNGRSRAEKEEAEKEEAESGAAEPAASNPNLPGHPREYIQAAVDYIEEHLAEEDLSIVSVATHVYLNPVYFGRVFKSTFDMTFKQYVLRQRMERAKQLLAQENLSISDVCEQVGVGNPSYFSRLFREYTGKLPSEYRRGE